MELSSLSKIIFNNTKKCLPSCTDFAVKLIAISEYFLIFLSNFQGLKK